MESSSNLIDLTTTAKYCLICGRKLNVEGDPMSADADGDCWGCIGKTEADMGYEPSIRSVQDEIEGGWRLADGTPKLVS